MADKIRWGILGCGNIARKFAADLRLVEEAELVAVASRSLEKARSFASDFGASQAHGSYEELAQNKSVDVIYIATPHSHHRDNTLLCLNNNKAVLCEKAFAVNSEQAREMIDLAKSKKLFLMEALWTKFLPGYKRLLEFLDEGKLGEINAVLINFGFRPQEPVSKRLYDPALAGGTLLDIGIYNVFMAMTILGEPDQIEASMQPASTGVDQQCAILFKYTNGAMANLYSSFLSNMATEADICGSKGRLRLTHRFYAPESTLEFYPDKPDSKQVIDVTNIREGHGYQYEASHVCECLKQGLTESPVMSFSDTLLQMKILDRIRKLAGIRYDADTR